MPSSTSWAAMTTSRLPPLSIASASFRSSNGLSISMNNSGSSPERFVMSMQRLRNPVMALAFLKNELSEGMTLAKSVLGEIDFTQGRMFVWMPPTIDQDTIENFGRSRRLAGGEKQEFCRFVRGFIQEARCALILQDTENWSFEGDEYERLAAEYEDEL